MHGNIKTVKTGRKKLCGYSNEIYFKSIIKDGKKNMESVIKDQGKIGNGLKDGWVLIYATPGQSHYITNPLIYSEHVIETYNKLAQHGHAT